MKVFIGLAISLFTTVGFAGECILNVTRTACPGHETTCYAKCGGKAICDEVKKTVDAAACAKEALKNCHVFRPGETKMKKVTAKFEGDAVEGGKDFCSPEKKEFNWNTCK